MSSGYVTKRLWLTVENSNNHVQDVLAVSYLANTIRTQMDLSNRLATAQLTMGGPEATGSASREDGGLSSGRGVGQRGGRGKQGQQRELRDSLSVM